MITSMGEVEAGMAKKMMKDLDNDMNDYLNYNNILSDLQTAFTSGGAGSSRLPLKDTQ